MKKTTYFISKIVSSKKYSALFALLLFFGVSGFKAQTAFTATLGSFNNPTKAYALSYSPSTPIYASSLTSFGNSGLTSEITASSAYASYTGWEVQTRYFYYTITAATGFNLTISAINSNLRSSNTGPSAIAVETSTSLTGPWTTQVTSNLSGTTAADANKTGLSISLSATNTLYIRYRNTSTVSANGASVVTAGTGRINSGSIVGTYTSAPTTPAPVISSSLTASGTVGTVLTSYTIAASNTPTSFNATSLPTGLSFSTPSISGTPTAAGTFNTTITATNSGGTDSKTLVFTISKGTSSITATGTTSYTYTGSAQGPATNTKSGSSGAVTYSYSGVSPTVYGPSSTAPNNVGTYQVIATVATDDNYNTASSTAYAFAITKASSSITATGTTSFVYTGSAQGPASNNKSGSTGAVTYSYSGVSPTVYGPSATAPNNVGTYEVIASVAADANYNTANSTSLAFSISPKALTISGITADNKAYDGTSTATISGTASLVGIVGSEDVTLTGTPTATFVSSAVGVGIDVTVSGYSITGAAIGNYTLTQPTLSANIIANTPTLFSSGTLAAVNATYGTASATPSSFSVSGQSLTSAITVTAPTGFEVSLSSASAYASSISVGAAGNVPSTLVYVRLTATNAVGNYSGNITLNSTGAAQVVIATASSNVAQKALTITGLSGVDKVYDGNTTATVSGTATLNGVVGNDDATLNSTSVTYAFATATAGSNKAITVLGFSLNGTTAGNYTVSQPTGITATINKANQTISAIAESQTLTFGAAAYSLATTAISGLTVAYSSSNTSVATVAANGLVTIVGAGSTTITASQSGNSNYYAATSVTQVVTVNKANQTIAAITASVTKTYGDANFSVATTATSGLTVTYSSDNSEVATVASNGTVTIVGVGTTTITAAQAGSDNYNAASSVTQVVTVGKLDQTITFNSLINRTTLDGTFTLTLNASSGLPITYTSSNTAIVSISGNIATIVGAGSTTITAAQAGNNIYNSATSVSQEQTILTPLVKWTFDAITSSLATSVSPNITAGSPVADLGVQITGSLFSALHANSSTAWSNPAGNGSAKSFTASHWSLSDYWQFKVNTSNYYDLAVAFDQTGSNTGPNQFKLQYSIDGTSFTDFGSPYAITNDSWSTTGSSKTASNKSFDLSALTSLNNKSDIYIRLSCNSTSGISTTFGTAGTNRVDNFTVTGTACFNNSFNSRIIYGNSYRI
ncbi:MAG: YDG domain-containing protein [Flavobacteriia bacterium]|nr:YDG domain-containing protein [Flavobacteriia bacterium]